MAKNQTPPAPPAPGTKVVALHPIDQRPPVGVTRTEVFFVVRQVLDQQLLRDSLEKLIRNHVPILGARLTPAQKEGGLEEYHYPETFPDDAKLFSWSAASLDSTLEASKLIPDVSNPKGAVVWGSPISDHEAAWTPSDWPRERTDDKPDTPLLLVHVTSYQDATVISLNIPHAVADQKGLASMVQAWLLVAQGLEPPPFIKLEPGALDGPSDLPQSELRKKGYYRVKTKGEHIRTILGLLPDLIKNREEDRRLMFLSASTVERLRDKCNEGVTEKNSSDYPAVTNGDIVTCILAKLNLLRRKKARYLALGETVNARGRIEALPEGQSYLHNCPAYACARFKFSRDTPLAEMARHHRLAVLETAKPASIERNFAITKKVFEGSYAFPQGEPGDISYHVTNWTSAWHGIDFSHAAKAKQAPEAQDQNHANQEATVAADVKPPMLVFGIAVQRSVKVHRRKLTTHYLKWKTANELLSTVHAPILCKADGGYWIDFSSSAKNMVVVDELLKRDPQLETL